MNHISPYHDFTARLKLLISKNPHLITTTLSNIFTMRLIGNKTHGDLAEIAIDEFINQYMYDFKSEHVGKQRFRAKEQEEDIEVFNEITKAKFPISLKAYGVGPLQLSTDKKAQMYDRLQKGEKEITTKKEINNCWEELVEADLQKKNVLALIYNEKSKPNKFNILVFDDAAARKSVVRIQKVIEGGRRKHPVYRFLDADGVWICEVRYGSGTANALQRGLWSHTKNASKYFESLTNGWVDYSRNLVLVQLFSHALIATGKGQEAALEKLKADIEKLKPARI